MTDNEDEVVAAIWTDRVHWSRTADRLKTRTDRARATALGLGSVGALATTSTATLLQSDGTPRTVVAAFGATCLAVGTLVSAHFLTPEAVRGWTRARATSEGIKRAVFEFRAGTGTTLADLRRDVAEISAAAEDLLPHVDTDEPVDADPPAPMTPDLYIQVRVLDQINGYYRPRAREYATRSARLRRLALALGIATALIAAAAAVAPGSGPTALAPWVAALTTLSGNVAAHLAARRYDQLVLTYLATANRLRRLVEDRRQSPDRDWAGFVDACETAIATENKGWMAKWSAQNGSS